ncbi:MAG: undecaprenyl-diphosphate phosphatase [Synechococcaceae bacterium WB8_1B_136]|nr:undecaprenyl-diphosphate phosphatase [Synechococcaceae bacterium WB8_1B_136]
MVPLASAETPGLLEACWRYLVLGVVQGLTEFLPISSTAAVIQLGSIVAVIAFFRRDLLEVVAGVARAARGGQWSDPSARLGVAILIGTVPIVLAGLAIKAFLPDFDHSPLRSLPSIGIVSIVMALLLALAEQLGRRRRLLGEVVPRDGLLVGLAQALALIPGVSRSGSTLTASLFDGWRRADAARFSFLLGIPAITLAGLVELKDAFSQPLSGGALPLLVGIVSAAVVSWLAIAWLLRFLQNHSTWWFVGYRLVFGLSLLLFAGRLAAGSN